MRRDWYEFNEWSFENGPNGELYVVADLPNNREWKTTQVLSVTTCQDFYIVATRNTVYHLYWR
jgi:hypothetical protein